MGPALVRLLLLSFVRAARQKDMICTCAAAKMAAALSTPSPKPALLCRPPAAGASPIAFRRGPAVPSSLAQSRRKKKRCWGVSLPLRRRLALHTAENTTTNTATTATFATSRADDSSAPFEMSLESALKLLGVSEGASFEDILRAKNAILASCKDDQDAVAQVEAAYDMLLMQSFSQRRAGKVDRSIRFADVKPTRNAGMSSLPQWVQATVKNAPIAVEAPSSGMIGINAGVYGALMVFTFVSGSSTPGVAPYTGADVPGLILATGFGASLYFLTKKNVKLGKAALLTVGGLVVGAVVGSAVESWLQVDIVPLFGVHSPAVVVSEFILFSQLLGSLYLR